MKVCRTCNQSYGDDTRFCPECGDPLQESSRSSDVQGAGQDDLIGRNFFGEYEIVDRLGEGGMGAVYLAEQQRIGQKVALKVLHTEAADSDEIIQRFHREAKVISRLTHPNIIRVFIFGRTADDLLYMAMEFVEGAELRNELDGTPMDELDAIRIIKQVCSAVAEAHDVDIIHRDLKPENILLTEWRGDDKFVKILDFGIAKIKHPDEQGPQLTQAGIVYGTPEYLSPEQAQAHDLDHRTDIYALGSILFEMMTGKVPFQADASVEILKQKVFEDPPKPSDYAPVAQTMEKIIMKAMAQDREDRFDDALDMFDALEQRENEIKREKKMDSGRRSFPGSELTGMHRAVSSDETDTLDDGEWEDVPETAAADPEQLPDGAQGLVADTAADSGEVETADTMAMQNAEGAGGGADVQSNPQAPGSGGGAASNPSPNARAAGGGGGQAASASDPLAGRGGQNPQQSGQRAQPNAAAGPGGNPGGNRRDQTAEVDDSGAGLEQSNPRQRTPRAEEPTHERSIPDQQQSAGQKSSNLRRYLLIGLVFVASSIFLGLLVYLVMLLSGFG